MPADQAVPKLLQSQSSSVAGTRGSALLRGVGGHLLLLLLDNTNGASTNPSDEFEKQPRFWGDARQVAQYLLLSTDSSTFPFVQLEMLAGS